MCSREKKKGVTGKRRCPSLFWLQGRIVGRRERLVTKKTGTRGKGRQPEEKREKYLP